LWRLRHNTEFFSLAGSAMVAWPLAARAQQKAAQAPGIGAVLLDIRSSDDIPRAFETANVPSSVFDGRLTYKELTGNAPEATSF
jgi:hypothetical protein